MQFKAATFKALKLSVDPMRVPIRVLFKITLRQRESKMYIDQTKNQCRQRNKRNEKRKNKSKGRFSFFFLQVLFVLWLDVFQWTP